MPTFMKFTLQWLSQTINKYIYSIMTGSGKWYEEKWRKNRTEVTEDEVRSVRRVLIFPNHSFFRYAPLKSYYRLIVCWINQVPSCLNALQWQCLMLRNLYSLSSVAIYNPTLSFSFRSFEKTSLTLLYWIVLLLSKLFCIIIIPHVSLKYISF